MLLLTLGETSQEIVVTLNEKRTLDDGFYLFVFTNVTTKDVVNKIYAFSEDMSDYQDRFNLFDIDTNSTFLNKPTGEWRYEVYEQSSGTNTDITGLTEVERGILQLKPATEFAFEQYDTPTTYKQYE
jgi:hypothetical protein